VIINVVGCNFELNGRGDRTVFDTMHDRIAELEPHIVCRMEVSDGEDKGGTLADAADARLKLRGYLSPASWTSVAYDTNVFTSVRGYDPGSNFPATVRVLRLNQAGPDSLPIAVAAAHLSYATPPLREIQAHEATRTADRSMRIGKGQVQVKLPALVAMDSNSFPEEGAPGDVPLPKAHEIRDKAHLLHRARQVAPGEWEMDTRPDQILRANGLMEDVARHAASHTPGGLGQPSALAPTTYATTTHGPAARVDRIYLSTVLLPAVVFVRVVPVPGLTDHHVVVLGLDSDSLADLLHELVVQAENDPLYALVPR